MLYAIAKGQIIIHTYLLISLLFK